VHLHLLGGWAVDQNVAVSPGVGRIEVAVGDVSTAEDDPLAIDDEDLVVESCVVDRGDSREVGRVEQADFGASLAKNLGEVGLRAAEESARAVEEHQSCEVGVGGPAGTDGFDEVFEDLVAGLVVEPLQHRYEDVVLRAVQQLQAAFDRELGFPQQLDAVVRCDPGLAERRNELVELSGGKRAVSARSDGRSEHHGGENSESCQHGAAARDDTADRC